MISRMRQILYASNTNRDVSDTFLNEVLATSRRNNAASGITGILLFVQGGFMQVLEGDPQAVESTFARICADKRHWNTTILLDREAPRAFAEWSMGFERPTPDQEGIFALTQDAIAGKLSPGASADIPALLRTFYRVNA